MAALVNTSGKATASSTTTITTGAVTPSGSNTAVLAFTIGESSSYATACNYTNSGGGAINDFVGADVQLNFSSFRYAYAKAFGEIASPTSSTTIYAGYGSTFNCACTIALFLQDADQTSPFGTALVSSETAITSSPTTVSQAFTGLTSGQLVVGALYLYDFAGTPSTAAVNTGTTLVDSQVSADVENSVVTIYAVKGTADGSGNCTLSMDVTTAGAAGTMARMYGVPIVGASGGATSHPSTGALVAEAATVAGTAARTRVHPSTGALAAQAAVVAGSALRTRPHPTSGSLVAGSATVAGDATRTSGPISHPTTGALAAQAATVAGSAIRTRLHPTSGALAAQAATLSGSAIRTRLHPSSGALVAQAAAVAGDAEVTPAVGPKESTGALQAQPAVVAGAATVTHLVSDATGGWGTYYPRKRKRIEPIDALPQGLEAIQEDANKRQQAIQARQALRRAELKDQQVTAQLRQIYAEQDALKRGVLKAKAQKAAEQDDEDAITILFALAS